MTEKQEAAIRSIREDATPATDRNHEFLRKYLRNALEEYCGQSEAFADAVLAEGKTLGGCIDACGQGFGHCSDLDLYKKAVEYYLPGAEIVMTMEIRVPEEKNAKVLKIDLGSFF